jgi:hypothetical protein
MLAPMARDALIASNEGLFRDVNDRIEEISQKLSQGAKERQAEEADFLCECGHENCTESVRMSLREYEDVRGDETLFLVFPGHEDNNVEEVVDRYERYRVVRKHPEDAAIAEATDPERH